MVYEIVFTEDKSKQGKIEMKNDKFTVFSSQPITTEIVADFEALKMLCEVVVVRKKVQSKVVGS